MPKKTLHTLLFLTLVSSLALVSGACSKKEVPPPTGGDTTGGSNITYPDSGSSEGTLSDSSNQQYGSMGQDGNQSDAYKREHGRSSSQFQPIYFDYDQSTIRQDMTQNLIANSNYMKSSSESIVIEGNCDARGTNEYNLALGERRAINAKKYMVDLGVNAARIRTVSYGEERPLFEGSDESSYQYNRRDDFVIE